VLVAVLADTRRRPCWAVSVAAAVEEAGMLEAKPNPAGTGLPKIMSTQARESGR
jgi:hypothetical protein